VFLLHGLLFSVCIITELVKNMEEAVGQLHIRRRAVLPPLVSWVK